MNLWMTQSKNIITVGSGCRSVGRSVASDAKSSNPVIGKLSKRRNKEKRPGIKTRTDTGSRVCGDYILMIREWKRSIDRLTEKILLDG